MRAQRSEQNGGDIIELILDDHVALKRLIKILKDDENDIGERYAAFGEFAPLLTIHAKPEEQTLYVEMKKDDDQRVDAHEGDIEHALAEQLLNEAKMTIDEDVWTAKVKVLAELVEHHIEEEEEEMLPQFRKNSDQETRLILGEKFLQLKEAIDLTEPAFIPTKENMSQPSIH
jgi:hypothetical protein